MEGISTISAQIDPTLKQNVEKIFHALDMTPSQAITHFYKQVESHQGLPSMLNRNLDSDMARHDFTAHGNESSTVIIDEIELYQSPDDEAMMKEEVVFREQQARLQKLYPNQYVAIHQGKVVDHDIDDVALLRRRRQKYGDKVVLFRHVDSDPDQVITIRSPRLVVS